MGGLARRCITSKDWVTWIASNYHNPSIDNRDVYKLENAGKTWHELLLEIYTSILTLVYFNSNVFYHIISIVHSFFALTLEARSINLLGFPGDGMAVFRAIASWRA